MTSDIIEIMKAPFNKYRHPGFFRQFSIKHLQIALELLEEEGQIKTEHRRRAIWYEIQRREKLARVQGVPVEDIIDVVEQKKYLDRAPLQTRSFIDDWNETCLSIYQRIQFMPPIPIVRR